MKYKAVFCAILCYLIWGCHSLFWNLFDGFSSMFLLATRIIMSCLLTTAYLCISGHGSSIIALIRDWKKMRYVIPAAFFVCADWGLYIWAVTSGHVLDCAMGYYLNPLVIFLFGVFLFREKPIGWEIAAIVITTVGLAIFTVISGFPMLSIVFAFVFPIYGVLKKNADSDAIVSIAVEGMILTPFAIAYILIFGRGETGLANVAWSNAALLILSGVVTGFPMILYTFIVNELPMKLVGIMQYMGTTIGMLCGILLLHETMTTAKWILLSFIVAGIVVFLIGKTRRESRLPTV